MPLLLLESIVVIFCYLVYHNISCKSSNMYKMLHLLTYSKKAEHITPKLKELHSPQHFATRILYNCIIQVSKLLMELDLNIKQTKYSPSRTLRSTNKELLVVEPKYNLETYGRRAFSVIAPILWNMICLIIYMYIRTKESLSTFKSRVTLYCRTLLFKRSF